MPESDPDKEFNANAIKFTHEAFWGPEIERRGGIEKTGPLRKALAIFEPGEPTRIYLNDEALLGGTGHTSTPARDGDTVALEDVDDIEQLVPTNISFNAGWVAYAIYKNGEHLSFDYRRHRGTAAGLLELADQYAATAATAIRRAHLGPAVENAHAASELAISALMFVLGGDPTGPSRSLHSRREGWLNDFTRHGNAPRDFHAAVKRMNHLRRASRYGDTLPVLRADEVAELVEVGAALVGHARAQVGASPHESQP